LIWFIPVLCPLVRQIAVGTVGEFYEPQYLPVLTATAENFQGFSLMGMKRVGYSN
jgi:hypothetical protein